jgi:hypothetical protein
MPHRRGKSAKVDVVALVGVLHTGRIFDKNWLVNLQSFALFHPRFERVKWSKCMVDTERECGTLRRVYWIREDSESLWVTWNIIEQKRGTFRGPCRYLSDPTDLQVHCRTSNVPQSVDLLHFRDEFA